MLGIYSYWSNCGLGYMAQDFYEILKDKYDIVGLHRYAEGHPTPKQDFVELEDDLNFFQWVDKHKIRNMLIFQFLNCKYMNLRKNYPSKMTLVPMGEFVEEENLHNLHYFDQIIPISYNTVNIFKEMYTYGLHLLDKKFYDKVRPIYYVSNLDGFLDYKVKFKNDIKMLMDVGRGGMWDRRNITYCLSAFREAAEHRDDIHLLFKTQREISHYDLYTRELLAHPQIEVACKDASIDELAQIRSRCQLNLTAQGFGEPDLVHFETLAMGMPQMVMDSPLFHEFQPDMSLKFVGDKQLVLPNNITFKTHPDINDLKLGFQNLDINDLKEKSKSCKPWVKEQRKECVEAIRKYV